MKNEPLAARIIEAAVKASALPVTVKFRKGWDEEHVNALSFARMGGGKRRGHDNNTRAARGSKCTAARRTGT